MAGPSFATFPGLNISRADMVLAPGVTPSVCHVVAVPQSTLTIVGDLILGDNGTPVIVFRDCAMDRIWDSPPYVKRGQRMNIRLLDRRWRWKGKTINGRYNVRRPDALTRTGTTATYWDLIALLLTALGETNYEIDPCAVLDGPTVDWSCARADLELAWLVEQIGCVVLLCLDNVVRVVPRGSGVQYPANGRERIPQVDFLPATSPWAARAEYGPTRFQSRLKLEAVGLEKDGRVLAIDSLSYKPAAGWRTQVPGVYNDVTDDTYRALARESVYRWYRIKSQVDGGIYLPGGSPYTISSIEDILPLSDDLIIPPYYNGFDPASLTNWPADKAFIEGYFWDGDLKGINENSDAYSYWDDVFQLDKERGIVKFDEYMFQVGTDGHHDPAVLYLTCSYGARANVYSSYWHYEYTQLTGAAVSASSGVATVRRPDLFQWFVQSYSESGGISSVYSNTDTIAAHGAQLANNYANTWRGIPQFDQEWSGIVPYSPNGNVLQMRWLVGSGPAMTYGSKNSEVPHWGPTMAERRLREKVERSLL